MAEACGASSVGSIETSALAGCEVAEAAAERWLASKRFLTSCCLACEFPVEGY